MRQRVEDGTPLAVEAFAYLLASLHPCLPGRVTGYVVWYDVATDLLYSDVVITAQADEVKGIVGPPIVLGNDVVQVAAYGERRIAEQTDFLLRCANPLFDLLW